MDEEQTERVIEALGDIASYLYNINRIMAKKEGYKGLIPPEEEETNPCIHEWHADQDNYCNFCVKCGAIQEIYTDDD